MVNEISIGLDFVNERCNTSYDNPEDVIAASEQLAAKLLAGEDVDYEFDSHMMAIDLFRAGGVMCPLRSYNMRLASKLWLSRN